MYPPDLTHEELEALDPESYSNYLAFGEVLMPEFKDDEEYEAYLESHRQYDL